MGKVDSSQSMGNEAIWWLPEYFFFSFEKYPDPKIATIYVIIQTSKQFKHAKLVTFS